MVSFCFHIISVLCIVTSLSGAVYYDDYFFPNHEESKAVAGNKPLAKQLPKVDDETVEAEDLEPERPTGYTCSLCMIVDAEFAEAYNINEGTLLRKTLQKLIEHASWVFRSTDWNNDGKPDNIGFKIARISYGWQPYKHETKDHYESPKPALEVLKIFARLNFTTCCLGVGFTFRPFQNGQDGISFAGSERLVGGICEHRDPREEFMTSANVILISGRGLNQTMLTSLQLAKALVHELGHAFGVHTHDNEYKDPRCWGFPQGQMPKSIYDKPSDGRYIMWAKSYQVHPILRKNTLRFSHCSKSTVANLISVRKKRRKCFELDYNPFCGNGIVEGIEMCDCGNEYDCSKQACCGSRRSEKPCMILHGKGCPANAFKPFESSGNLNPVSNLFSVLHIIITLRIFETFKML